MRADALSHTPSFHEIRTLIRELPGPDLAVATMAAAHEAGLSKPIGALGRLEEIAAWIATWQARHPPRLDHPRIAVFAGNHGIAARGVSAYRPADTARFVAQAIAGEATINRLATLADADLRVYEMALEQPTQDFTQEPAMTEEECARAMAYGMMAVEPGIDLLCLGEMGVGNTTAAAAIACALHGGKADAWVGPGTGVSGEARRRKAAVVAEGIMRHRLALEDGLEVLRRFGGHELAAIAGAILAARLARVPVILDGFAATAAAAALARLDPRILAHCRIADRTAEPGHARLIEKLGQRPLQELGIGLGEAAGAALAILVVRAAVQCHVGGVPAEQRAAAIPRTP